MTTTLTILLLLSPALVGAIIAALNSDAVNDATEKAEAWVRNKQKQVSSKPGRLYRYILNPILSIIVKFCDWTDNLSHRGLKNGIRVASTLYLLAACGFLLYLIIMLVAFAVVVLLVLAAVGAVLYILSKVYGNSNEEVTYSERKTESVDALKMVGSRGKNLYSGSGWLDEELKGRVDEDGNIYSGTNWLTEKRIGRISKDGTIYQGSSFIDEKIVGRVDKDGTIHKGSDWFSEKTVGRIDKDGEIHEGTSWLNEKTVGRSGE
jgi:hypothetical protein